MRKQILVANKILREPPMRQFSKVESAARYDWIDWPHTRLYLGAVFLLLPRLINTTSLVFIAWILHHVDFMIIGKGKFLDEQSVFFHYIKTIWKCFIMRPLCQSVAVYKTTYKKHRISDLIADYKPFEKGMKDVQAPISISNHFSMFDMIVLLNIFPYVSFISKIGVGKVPMIGPICTRLQSIYIHRGDSSQASATANDIKTRADNIMAGKTFPTLMIFPEGTTNNGWGLMKFKQGAFVNECPLKIYAIEYKTLSGFNPS